MEERVSLFWGLRGIGDGREGDRAVPGTMANGRQGSAEDAYPAGAAMAASADEDGGWFDYTYPNPVSGAVETKHFWMVIHDGLTFGSG